MPRTALLRDWLDGVLSRQHPNQEFQLEPASADASFRRYFRVSLPDGNSRIVMDAPPEFEDCRPFLQVASLFAAAGVHVPVVYDKDLDHGFLLLSDLGSTTYPEYTRNFLYGVPLVLFGLPALQLGLHLLSDKKEGSLEGSES